MVLTKQKAEEILEAVWVAEEMKDQTRQCVRDNCPETVTDQELELLEHGGVIEIDGERIRLTEKGRHQAEYVIRCHRLTESLLINVLQMPSERAHEIACHMEHLLPPEMARGICTLLGHPEVTPDGRAIPRGEDCLNNQLSTEAVIVSLADLKPGEKGRITYIRPKNHKRSHQLAAFGLVPGITIELHQRFPAYCIMYEGTELALDEDVARDIYVCRGE